MSISSSTPVMTSPRSYSVSGTSGHNSTGSMNSPRSNSNIQSNSGDGYLNATATSGGMVVPPRHMIPLVGWVGNISRVASEEKLKNYPQGTFLLRWSTTTKSYVLSFVTKSVDVQHIAYIIPGNGGQISIVKEDKTVLEFPDLLAYLKELRSKNIISDPINLNSSQPANLDYINASKLVDFKQ